MKILFLISILISAGFCHAQDGFDWSEYVVAEFEAAQEKMDQVRKPNFSECSQLPTQEAKACLKFYEKLKNKKTIRMDYFIGYTNHDNDFVADPFEHRAMIVYMTEPCPAATKQATCGFKRDEYDADLLTKEVKWPDGQVKRIELRVVNAAASPYDSDNRTSPVQTLKSQQARQKFIEAARDSDILIYSGHSRYGGGPDFSPEYQGKGSHAAYYRKNRQGLKDLQQGLKDRKDDGPTLVVMSSCDSDLHFNHVLKTTPKGPKAAYLTSSAVTEPESYRGNIEVQETVLTGTCPSKKPNEKNFLLRTYH